MDSKEISEGKDPRELKGEQYLHEAERALKRWTIFGIGADAKREDAAGFYEKAAAQFKAAKKARRSADAYMEAAKQLEAVRDEFQATTNWKNAATQLVVSGDNDEAVKCYTKAIDVYIATDRFDSVARLQSEIGKMYEDKKIYDKAIHFYNESISSFELENKSVQARKVKGQVADLQARTGEYQKAVDLYEEISRDSTDGPQKWSVKKHLFKSSICQLVLGSTKDDMTEAGKAFEKYEEWSDIFCGSRENKLVQDLKKAYDEKKTEAFQDAIFEFETISKLEEFNVTLLHIVLQELKKEHTPPIFDNDGKTNEQKVEVEDDFR